MPRAERACEGREQRGLPDQHREHCRREKPIAFRIAISRIRSRTAMLAVLAAMNTMHTARSAARS